MKIYISGQITGLPLEEAKTRFAWAARQIEAYGYAPINPFDNGVADDAPWEEHMVADINRLLNCDGIYLLQGWDKSSGARIEEFIARERGLQILNQPEYATCQSKM